MRHRGWYSILAECDEQSDGPKRWIDRFLMGNLLATAAVIGGVTAERYY